MRRTFIQRCGLAFASAVFLLPAFGQRVDLNAPIIVSLSEGSVVPSCSPLDGSALQFKFPASGDRLLRFMVNVPMDKAIGRWSTGHPNDDGGVQGSVWFGDMSGVANIRRGVVTISTTGEETIVGSIDFTLESGQRIVGPFKALALSHKRPLCGG